MMDNIQFLGRHPGDSVGVMIIDVGLESKGVTIECEELIADESIIASVTLNPESAMILAEAIKRSAILCGARQL